MRSILLSLKHWALSLFHRWPGQELILAMDSDTSPIASIFRMESSVTRPVSAQPLVKPIS